MVCSVINFATSTIGVKSVLDLPKIITILILD